jgi:hypothetical protein
MSKTIKQFHFKKAINLYCFTDVHIGAKGHDAKKFQRAVELLKKDPNGYCFFNGDTVEFIPPNYGIPESGQELDIEAQLDAFEAVIKPITKKTLFIRAGNHEMRGWKLSGADPIKRIAKNASVKYLHEGMEEVHVHIGSKKLRLVTSHGEGGGSKKVLSNMQLTFPGADLYFSGHTHEMYVNEGNLTVNTESGIEEFKKQIEIVGGSFLGWADYARAKNMRPTQTGCYILTLDQSGVRVKGKVV